FIKSPVLCCGENITFHQVAKFSVPLHMFLTVLSDSQVSNMQITELPVCMPDCLPQKQLQLIIRQGFV
ncbi:hypothetical protein PO479_21955, partial [Escherichia coli]